MAGQGEGENALQVLLQSSEVEVLGVVAVAANTQPVHGVDVVVSVTQDGQVIEGAVDKSGEQVAGHLLRGDTVDVLESYQGPVVGLGDPGKMDGHDSVKRAYPSLKRHCRKCYKGVGGMSVKFNLHGKAGVKTEEVHGDLQKDLKWIKSYLGYKETFDLIVREFELGSRKAALVYIDTFVSQTVLTLLMQTFLEVSPDSVDHPTLQKC